MKTFTLIILTCATLLGFGLYLHEVNRSAETKTTLQTLQNEVGELKSEVAAKEARVATLQAKLSETREKVVAKVDEAAQLQVALTNKVEEAEASNKKKSNPLSEMFKSPEMKDFVKNQQKTVIGTIIDKHYAAFFSSMNMTPEQSAALKDLISKKSLMDAQAGLNMLSGDMDADKRIELTKQTKAEKDAVDQEIKSYLGDDAFKDFQAYEKTMPERMAIGTFADQQLSGANRLTAEQQTQLVDVMSRDRQNFKFSTDLYDQSKIAGDPANMLTGENVDKFLAEQQNLNQQYLVDAQGILTPEQYTAFEKFLKSQTEMQRLGMSMVKNMFNKGEN